MAGIQKVSHMTILVNDPQAALQWYQKHFGVEVKSDMEFEFAGQPSRWLTVGFPGTDLELVLMKPMLGPEGQAPDPAGNGTMTILQVDDCRAETARLESEGVQIVMPASDEAWGISSVIRDLDGNPYNLVQPPSGTD